MRANHLNAILGIAIYFLGVAFGHPLDDKRALATEVKSATETVANAFVHVDEGGAPYATTTVQRFTRTTNVLTRSTPTVAVTRSSPDAGESKIAPTLSTLLVSSAMVDPKEISQEEYTTHSISENPPAVSAITYLFSSSHQSDPTPLGPSTTLAPTSNSAIIDVTPQEPVPQKQSDEQWPIGITYDPFAGNTDNTRCKTEEEVDSEFEQMSSYQIIRIYAMDCNIIPRAMKNVVQNGQKLMAGAYLTSDASTSEDLDEVIQALSDAVQQYAGGNWDIVSVFSVENEKVNERDMSAAQVVDAIHRARELLRRLGYNGPVGAVETVPATTDNPSICDASDIVMVNCHAFFDSGVEASRAGEFVRDQVELVRKACNGKRVVVTESGWPHRGEANGKAVPSQENQQLALESIRSAFDHDLFMFNAFDSLWKSDWASSFSAERYWGTL